MSLIELLVEARAGIGLQLPSSFEALADRETFACWRDLELGVRVIVMHSHDPLDLRDARAATLAGDVKAGARRMFAQMHRTLAAGSTPEGPTPLDDSDWSPVVELEVIERDDGRILRCIHGLAAQPGREIVRGLLLIPTAYGHISLSAIHDARQAGDGLERVRTCLARWLDPASGISITPEPIQFADDEVRVDFDASDCSIVLPVGFMPQSPDPSAKSRGITTLVRVGIDEAPEAKLTVGAIPNEDGLIADAAGLLAAARASVEAWAERGASNIEITSEHVTATRHRAQVCVYASLRADEGIRLLVAQWILTDRGAVFRFELWTRPPHQFGDWAPLVEAAVQTWRRGSNNRARARA